jgi:hypothetical protein
LHRQTCGSGRPRRPAKDGSQPVSSWGPAISTWHIGSHDRLGEAYGRLQAWLSERDRKAAGAAREVYWWIDPTFDPDPANWPPPAEWRCELVQPVA